MKIGFFDTCLLWVPHFETDLELMEIHLKKGDEVVWFDCNENLPFCQPNPLHRKKLCKSCIKRKNKGLALYQDQITIKNWLTDNGLNYDIPQVKNIEELKLIKYKDFDIGLATVSSLVSVLREPNPDMEKHAGLWTRAYESSLLTYTNMLNSLSEGNFDKVYIFNGRYAVERAVVRACEKLNIEYTVHERGRDINHYMLYDNSLPHNRKAWLKRMNEAWNDPSVSNEEKERIGKSFFIDRTKGKEEFWISFVHDMKEGYLPENYDENKTNVTIFTSSEDEMISISDEWKNSLYDSQYEGIKRILGDSPEEYQFYLRIHPNMIGINSSDIEKMKSLEYPNLTIIPPDSNVNSYSLIKASDKVITFGSTVGVEASFWETPSILAGVSYYHGTNATYDAKSHQDVIELINTNPLKPKEKTPALMYGYYLKTFGYKFKNYEGVNFYLGKYKGEFLYGNFFDFMLVRIASAVSLLRPIKRLIKRYRPYSSRIARKAKKI